MTLGQILFTGLVLTIGVAPFIAVHLLSRRSAKPGQRNRQRRGLGDGTGADQAGSGGTNSCGGADGGGDGGD